MVYISALDSFYNWHYIHRQHVRDVLIIGDSISIGYTPIVRELLKKKADVNRPLVREFSYIPTSELLIDHGEPVNCKTTLYSLKELDRWLDGRKWDVIHANWGLWDADTIDEVVYAAQLELLIKRILPHTNVLIISTTTPIAENENSKESRLKIQKISNFNKVVVNLARKYNLEVNDLHSVTVNRKEIYAWDNVHFNGQGYELLAEKVAGVIEKYLSE